MRRARSVGAVVLKKYDVASAGNVEGGERVPDDIRIGALRSIVM
jgi:hypothetical protein